MPRFLTFLKNIELTANQLILIVSAYIVLVFNVTFISKTVEAITSLPEYKLGFLLSVPFFLFSLTLILISLVSFSKLVKPILIFLVINGSLLFYAAITYGVIFDYGMVQNTVETDSAEALTYLNFYAIVFFLFFGVLPSVAIAKVKVVYKPLIGDILQRLKLIVAGVIITGIIASLYYSDYASVGRNNRILTKTIVPFTALVATSKYINRNYLTTPLPFTLLDEQPEIISSSSNKSVTVFVVGETARASNFSLNGYSKNTNSNLQESQVISYKNVSSCGTATAVSVPCMFSRLSKNDYDKRVAHSQQNLLDIVKLAGVDVLWVDNNSSCKGVCQRVNTVRIDTNKKDPNCDGKYCFDQALLKPLSEKLASLEHDKTLIVLHMIGSHGPTYYRRYPKDMTKFQPDCPRSDIQNCSSTELVNTYDNTIAYTDYVLSEIIKRLQTLSSEQSVKTNMLYVSDHGESLGENGVYLHGLPYVFAPVDQTHIPMIYWQDENTSINTACLQANSDKSYSHDNIFDSILGLLSVQSTVYKQTDDIFAQCKDTNMINK